MITFRLRRLGAIALVLAAATALPVVAQTAGSAPPQTIPGLDDFSLPPSQPTPRPTPTAAPTTTLPTTLPILPRATPTPRATPSPRARPAPRATPKAVAAPVTAASPTPVAPLPTPSTPTTASVPPLPEPSDLAMQQAEQGAAGWWIAGLVAVGLVAVGLMLWRRRGRIAVRAAPRDGSALPPHPPAPQPDGAPAAAPEPATAGRAPLRTDRAQITLALSPRRAGLNLLSATVEAELLVRNAGACPAAALRIGATLLGAGREDEVTAVFGQPVVRPITPPFALAAGEERRVRVVVALPRGDIRVMTVRGRAMFVPVVAINAVYEAGDRAGQTARAFAVGVRRVDAERLAPFWLDQPPRMHDDLGVRPYATAVER